MNNFLLFLTGIVFINITGISQNTKAITHINNIMNTLFIAAKKMKKTIMAKRQIRQIV